MRKWLQRTRKLQAAWRHRKNAYFPAISCLFDFDLPLNTHTHTHTHTLAENPSLARAYPTVVGVSTKRVIGRWYIVRVSDVKLAWVLRFYYRLPRQLLAIAFSPFGLVWPFT
jgi:hypothetical protein